MVKKVALIVLVLLGMALGWFATLFHENVPVSKNLLGDLGLRRLLIVFAHPDDELSSYTLIFKAKESGVSTMMLTLTQGEKGYYEPYISKLQDLGKIRTAEVLKSGYFLGIGQQKVDEFSDGNLKDFGDPAIKEIVDQICAFKPDGLLTFDPQSGYTGHEDHKAAGEFSIAAIKIALSNCPDVKIKHTLFPLMPRKVFSQWGGDVGREVVATAKAPTHAISGLRWIKLKGWSIHESQKDFVRKQWKMNPGFLYMFYRKEFYAVE